MKALWQQVVALLLSVVAAIAYVLNEKRKSKQAGREEVENEFQANDTRQAQVIIEEVERTKVHVSDLDDGDVIDGLREDGGLRKPDSDGNNSGLG